MNLARVASEHGPQPFEAHENRRRRRPVSEVNGPLGHRPPGPRRLTFPPHQRPEEPFRVEGSAPHVGRDEVERVYQIGPLSQVHAGNIGTAPGSLNDRPRQGGAVSSCIIPPM